MCVGGLQAQRSGGKLWQAQASNHKFSNGFVRFQAPELRGDAQSDDSENRAVGRLVHNIDRTGGGGVCSPPLTRGTVVRKNKIIFYEKIFLSWTKTISNY